MLSQEAPRTWTFLTNHAQALLCLIASAPPSAQRKRILAELMQAGFVTSERVGRRNRYTVDRQHAMRHSAQLGHDIGTLLEALG